MKTKLFAAAALTLFFWLGNAFAQDWGDRYENRLDNRSERAAANGHEQRARHLDRQGDRIENRLDRRGDRIDNRLDRKGQRVNRRADRRQS